MYWDFERENTIRYHRQESKIFDDTTAISAYGMVDPTPGQHLQHETLEQHQGSIPRLPIPSLKETCALYLRSIEGLVNAEEYEATEERVKDFLQPGGAGEKLQELLVAREGRQEQPSWLEEFWDDAYLCTRDPIPINVNYFFGVQNHPRGDCMTQVGRAASLMHAALEFYVSIRDRTLSNDMERTSPLCMSQFRRVFGTSRLPGRGRDSIVCYSTQPLTADEAASKTCSYVKVSPRHCVVIVRNRYYQVTVLEGEGEGGVLPLGKLIAAIAEIVHRATDSGTPPGPPVGVLTTMERDDWAMAREQLVELGNDDLLVRVQSALLVVCLDSMVVADSAEAARLFLHGTGTNRWFDRHNLIVARNGVAGLNFEHSVGDGVTTLRVADYMVRQDAKRAVTEADVAAAVAEYGRCDGLVRELVWRLDSSVDRVMKAAFDDFIELIECNETTVLNFRHFGGNLIKNSKLSPDAFVQLAFQLTYYRLFGRNDATYEAASTRAFLHGRTETVRSATRAAADFCSSAQDPIFSRRVGSVIPNQHALLRQAADAHVDYMKQAKNARGVDRHFFGLRMMAKQHNIPMPSIFTDPVFARSTHWNLSTSHCGSTALNLFGFGPVVPDGFGLGYMIFNDCIHVVITSKYTHRLTSSSIFASILEASMLQMQAMLECSSSSLKERKALQFQHPTAYNDFQYEPVRGFVYKSNVRKSLYGGDPSCKKSSSSLHLDDM